MHLYLVLSASQILQQEQVAWLYLFLSVLAVIGLTRCAAWVGRWLRPHKPNPAKNATYECGSEPIGQAVGPIHSRLYTLGCVFILFELETILLFPWAIVGQKNSSLLATADTHYRLYMALLGTAMILFLAIGLAYMLIKGQLLEEIRPKPYIPVSAQGPIPHHHYEQINVKYAPTGAHQSNL